MIDRIPRITGVAVVALLAASFGAITAHMQPRPPERSSMDSIAQQYVRLVLALGQHDADYVDAYYGPPEWKTEAQTAKLDLTMIGDRASRLRRELAATAAQRPSAHAGASEEFGQLRRIPRSPDRRARDPRTDAEG